MLDLEPRRGELKYNVISQFDEAHERKNIFSGTVEGLKDSIYLG